MCTLRMYQSIDSDKHHKTPQMAIMNRLLLTLLVAWLHGPQLVQAWTQGTGSSQKATHSRQRPSSSVQYAPTDMPTTETAGLSAQKMLQNGRVLKRSRIERPDSSLQLSQSVLASCDTLPKFPTAHGLLSPETVMRIQELISREGHCSEALVSFLKTYKRHGPMSCLPMLSDPDILKHLTRAMRESMN